LLRKTLHTFATLLFGQGSSIAAGIAVAHAFGPSGRGILSFAAILLTFAFTTADGVRNAVAFQIGNEGRDARSVWATALRLMAAISPLGIVAFLGLWQFTRSQPAYLYVALAFPFALYSQAVGIVYFLRDRNEEFNLRNAATIGGGGSLVTLVLVLAFHASVAVVLDAWLASYVVAAVWSAFGVGAMLGPPGVRERNLLREQVTFVGKSALSNNVTFLALRVDVFIVSAFASVASLGIYTLALATGEIMWGASKSLYWSASGRVATLPLAEAAALTARIVRLITAMQFVVGVALFAIGPWLISTAYGGRFVESGSVLRVLLPGMILYSADGMLSYFIAVRAGRPGLLLGLECVTLGICATIAYATIGRYGILGPAVADTVAYVASYVVKMNVFCRLSGLGFWHVAIPRFEDVPYALRLRARALVAGRPADL